MGETDSFEINLCSELPYFEFLELDTFRNNLILNWEFLEILYKEMENEMKGI